VAAGPNVIGGGQLARHNRVNRRASVEVTRQCRREGFRVLKYRFASRCHGRQCKKTKICDNGLSGDG
jgi:hypothetical protein